MISSSGFKGVNYGNRFIPEDWMVNTDDYMYGPKYGPVVNSPGDGYRVSLCDVEDSRILHWLDDSIKEDDFKQMQEYGVEVLRVPTGYWNWISTEDAGPNAPPEVAKRLANLATMASPDDYSVYIDAVFTYAERYGIKVLLDLHGAPGSQNSEIHSGCVTNKDDGGSVKPEHYFDTTWNMQLALEAIDEMAKRCADAKDVCFGIQVLNEPQVGKPSPGPEDLLSFLDRYYSEAILRAREFLDDSVPVVLFSWTYNFDFWGTNHYPEETYGKVMWDTHLYYPTKDTVEEAIASYQDELPKVSQFA